MRTIFNMILWATSVSVSTAFAADEFSVASPQSWLSPGWVWALFAAAAGASAWFATRRVAKLPLPISSTSLAANPEFKPMTTTQLALGAMHIPVITVDARGHIEFINHAAETLLQSTKAQVIGRLATEVAHLLRADGRRVDNITAVNGEYRLVTNGLEKRLQCVATPIVNRQNTACGYVLTLHAAADTAMSSEYQHSADHDVLTGLPNRAAFEQILAALLKKTQGDTVWHSLCYLDLDNFKIINDTCGHTAGDALLREISELLRNCVRNSDIVARLGGDEFALLLENCPLEQAQRISEKVRQKIAEFHFNWEDRPYTISASIGIVEISPATANIAHILSTADVACFAAKDLGRNRVHVYLESDDESSRRHGEMQWYGRITQAHAENRFTLYHQRIQSLAVDPSQGAHFEILVRMIDEKGQLVAPGMFMPAAERYNLMPMIDRWVIRETFATVKLRHALGERYPETIAINLSGASLGDQTLLPYIKQQFGEHGIPASIICFEITETAAISNLANAVIFIKESKSMGCRFSLDDFGSGLSSFTYLKNMPVDYLKIDGSFVKDMLSDSINMAMVESINQIGHVMGIKTIAEFVETTQLADKLKLLGVDYAQGYGIDKPSPYHAKVAVGH